MASRDNRVELLSGNDACALGAIAAGCRFFAGYPITPSTEVAERMALELPRAGGVFIQMEDEIASMGAILGASMAGMKSMTATSGPGYSLMVENIGYAAMAEIPCVIVNVMRGGPSTGLPTKTAQADIMQSRWGSHGDRPAIALMPSTVLECFTLTVRAFNLAEKYRMPVTLLSDEVVGHMTENTVLPRQDEITIVNRIPPSVPPDWYVPYDETVTMVPPMAAFGEGYRYNVTGLTHDRMGFPTSRPDETAALLTRLINKVKRNLRDLVSVEETNLEDAEMAVIAAGSVARVARSAVRYARDEGIKVGLLRLITVWPFPSQQIDRLADKVKDIVVAEMNFGQIAGEVMKYVQGKARVHRLHQIDSELMSAETILKRIRDVVAG